jgi:hypothetical protein
MPAIPDQNTRAGAQPIACALPAPGLAARSAELKAGLFAAVEESHAVDGGIAYRFDGADVRMHALFAFIEAERTCCSFLRFNLAFEPGKGSIWLRVTGPEEAREFIRETFGAPL